MEKYLGNKRKILSDIQSVIDSLPIADKSLIDIFAGTNNVGKHFKRLGFLVYANDKNECSAILAKAYIEQSRVPKFSKVIKKYKLRTRCTESDIQKYFKLNSNGHKYSWEDFLGNENLVYVLTFLSFIHNNKSCLSKRDTKKFDYFFSRNYAPNGVNSSYIDRNGNKGRRMFFTPEHARSIDLIVNVLRLWKKQKLITNAEHALLVSSLIHAASLFSNTSGVYEAFYKEWFPNTKQKFRLPVPELASFTGPKGKGYSKDAIEFSKKFNKKVGILYLDPPYNTRQYSSNYHLLNSIAKFHRIRDFNIYEKNLIGARGENKQEIFRSNFSSKKTFISSLEILISNIESEYVVLSYFDGDDNLWGDRGNKEGIQIITHLFSKPEIFEKGSFKLVKISRKNFQSRSGKTKSEIKELIFVAKRRKV